MTTEQVGRFDPFELAGIERNAEDEDGGSGLINFAPECCGQKEAIGVLEWAGLCVKLDTETGQVVKVGQAVSARELTARDYISAYAVGTESSIP